MTQSPMEASPIWLDRWRQKIRHWLDQFQPPESLVLIFTAILVGSGTGLEAVLFVWLLDQIARVVQKAQALLGDISGLLITMTAAGLLVGAIVHHWAVAAKGRGIPEVMEAVALRNGRIAPHIALTKLIASSLTIGVGGSAGRERPMVQIGSALGSAVGQLFHFSTERVRTLVACGAAAGISAAFNAPIAGSIFALEIILGRLNVRYFGAVVISSVSAGIVGQRFLGAEPAFRVPEYPFQVAEIPIYVALGLLAALTAVLFVRWLHWTDTLCEKWNAPPAIQAGLGMLLTGSLALLLPERQILGTGLDFIGTAIAADFSMPLQLMAVLLLLKLLATSFTLSTGNSGGVFAPMLFIGAILGGMVGSIAHTLWPTVALNPGAYAIVGMAAVFSGAARAPITAVLIVFEMSNDYRLILPLMMATVLATLLAEHLFNESIYTLKLKQRGITLQRGQDLDVLQSMTVKEAMTSDSYVVSAQTPLPQLDAHFQQTHSHSFPVVDETSRLVGIISIRDFERAMAQPHAQQLLVRDAATMGNLLLAYADEPLSDAIQRMGTRGVSRLPVVTRTDPDHLVGVIRRRDIVRAYNISLARRAREQYETDIMRLRRVDGTDFIEVEIRADSPAVNKTVAQLAPDLPQDCVIVSIRRRGNLLIPHGNTVFQVADQVQVFVRQEEAMRLKNCFLGKPSGRHLF